MSRPITYPALYRQGSNVGTGRSAEELCYKLETLGPVVGDFDPARAGLLLDAAGQRFEVRCWRDVPARGVLERIRRMMQFAPVREPVVEGSTRLSLDEFKREIESAVRALGKASQDLDLEADLREPLTRALSYVEALAAVPEPI